MKSGLFLLVSMLVIQVQASIFTNRVESIMENPEYLDYALCGLGILLGLILCFCGYRLFKPVLFIVGFVVGAGICYYVLWYHTNVGLVVLIVGPIIAGIILGLFMIFVAMAGIFLLGAVLGFLLWSMVISARDGGLIHNEIAIYVGLGACTLIGGVVALIFQKALIITATSFGGAYAVVVGVDRFVHGGFSRVIPLLIEGNRGLIVCTYKTYIEFGACVLLCVIGMYIQFRHTGKNVYHKVGAHRNEEDGYFALHE